MPVSDWLRKKNRKMSKNVELVEKKYIAFFNSAKIKILIAGMFFSSSWSWKDNDKYWKWYHWNHQRYEVHLHQLFLSMVSWKWFVIKHKSAENINPNSIIAKKTKIMQAIIQFIIWVVPTESGDLAITFMYIVCRLRKRIINRDILPGIISNGITNPICNKRIEFYQSLYIIFSYVL